MSDSTSYSEYPKITVEVTEPSYRAALKWMQTGDFPNISYDCWSRGNYTRRLLWQHLNGITQLNVAVKSIEEIRWAYSRLALLGMPTEFVYTGPMLKENKALTLYPWDMTYDAGWGYIVALDKSARKIRGQYWCPIMGNVRPMPDAVVSWLANEAAEPFTRGDVSIAPAELIGFNTKGLQLGLSVLSEIGGGIPISPDLRMAQTLLDLELPYLDNMTVKAIEKFRRDHDPELDVFRLTLRKLITNAQASATPHAEIIQELKTYVAELRLSTKYASLQRDVLKLGGVFALFSASLGALLQYPTNVTVSTLGFTGASAASIALIDLLKQAREAKWRMAENPCFVLWELGLHKESDVRATRRTPIVSSSPINSEMTKLIPDTAHWLCPPTNGFLFMAVRKSEQPR